MSPTERPPRRGFRPLMILLVLVTLVLVVARTGTFQGLAQAIGRSRRPAPAVVRAVDLEHQPDATAAMASALARFAAIGRPVYCGGGEHPFVALTFDDGPGPYTERTLDILNRAGARGTFFLVGRQLEAWPALAGRHVPRRERAAGAVGDHTWTHADVTRLSSAGLEAEIARTQTAVAEASGGPVLLFRPPYGARNEAVDAYVSARGMVEVLWSVDSGDSAGATPQEELATVLDRLRPGAIVLLHENRGSTLSILPDILAALQRRGLQAVSVPYLLAHDPPSEAQLRTGACPASS